MDAKQLERYGRDMKGIDVPKDEDGWNYRGAYSIWSHSWSKLDGPNCPVITVVWNSAGWYVYDVPGNKSLTHHGWVEKLGSSDSFKDFKECSVYFDFFGNKSMETTRKQKG